TTNAMPSSSRSNTPGAQNEQLPEPMQSSRSIVTSSAMDAPLQPGRRLLCERDNFVLVVRRLDLVGVVDTDVHRRVVDRHGLAVLDQPPPDAAEPAGAGVHERLVAESVDRLLVVER